MRSNIMRLETWLARRSRVGADSPSARDLSLHQTALPLVWSKYEKGAWQIWAGTACAFDLFLILECLHNATAGSR